MSKKRFTEFIREKFEIYYQKKRIKNDELFLKQFKVVTEFSAMFKLYSDQRFYMAEFELFLNENADRETLIKFCEETEKNALVYLLCKSLTKSITFRELINYLEENKGRDNWKMNIADEDFKKYTIVTNNILKKK